MKKDIHERLQEIAEAVNKGQNVKTRHKMDLGDSNNGKEMLPFWKKEDAERMIEVCDRYIEYWQRKYHQLLVTIPYVQLAVSLLDRAAKNVPQHRIQIMQFLSTLKEEDESYNKEDNRQGKV